MERPACPERDAQAGQGRSPGATGRPGSVERFRRYQRSRCRLGFTSRTGRWNGSRSSTIAIQQAQLQNPRPKMERPENLRDEVVAQRPADAPGRAVQEDLLDLYPLKGAVGFLALYADLGRTPRPGSRRRPSPPSGHALAPTPSTLLASRHRYDLPCPNEDSYPRFDSKLGFKLWPS